MSKRTPNIPPARHDDQEISSGLSSPSRRMMGSNTDDPSQLTIASSKKSSYSFETLSTVVRNASMILTGRLPEMEDGNSRDAPWNDTIVEVPENSSNRNLNMDGTTEHAVTGGNGQDSDDDSRGSKINFLHDDPNEMTLSRRIALSLMNKAWYNPAVKSAGNETASQSQQNGTNHTSSGDAEVKMAGEASLARAKATGRHLDAYPFTVSTREKPSLAKAWAYFEHVAMPRYLVEKEDQGEAAKKKNICTRAYRRVFCKGDQQLKRAEPGEAYLPSKLYKPIFTPHNQLGDWGLGIGLYFSTLRAITVLTFLAGLLNIPNIQYFVSDEYSDGQTAIDSALVRGSAVCTDSAWVPCIDCDVDDRDKFAKQRVLNVRHNDTQELRKFTLKNMCEGPTLEQGFINYGTLFLVVSGIFLFSIYLKYMEVKYDEDEQTAQDYSIVVENPPEDATDPEEWRRFFYENFEGAHVTAITIAVDNDLLVKSLVERREVLRKIEMMVEPGTSLDTLTLAGIAAKEERRRRFFGRLMASLSAGVPELFARLVVLTSKVQGLSQQSYPASHVFITFETEAGQRRVLEALSLGSLAVSRNTKSAVKNEKHLFRGEHVLKITEPDEPNTIRWQDLNEKFKERLKQQLSTTLCTLVAIFVIALLVEVCNGIDAIYSAIAISIFNSIFPMFAKFLCNFEAHSSEGGKQRSLYFKIAVFRWVNTAIVITIITPFTSTLSTGEDDGLITKIYAIFFAEIVTTNAIQLADLGGHFKRHFLAPRASSQDAMNLMMSGEEFELAERYTNMTKILFLAVWYCAIYPSTLFLCSFTLLVNYFTDRFSLMRAWKKPPMLGPKISQFSRKYFFTVAVLAMAVMSSYYWAGFPFDNLCPTNSTVPPEWVGIWVHEKEIENTTSLFGTTPAVVEVEDPIILNVGDNDILYKYCLQDFFRYRRNETSFPFISAQQREGSEWMTEDQEILTDVYGWTVVGIMVLIILSFISGWWEAFMSLFKGSYVARGDDQGINFSDVPSISTFVPQVESPVYAYPLLACSVDDIDDELLDWTDPDRPYSFYDLTKDAAVLLKGIDVSNKVVFSRIVHYPPDKKETLKETDEKVSSPPE